MVIGFIKLQSALLSFYLRIAPAVLFTIFCASALISFYILISKIKRSYIKQRWHLKIFLILSLGSLASMVRYSLYEESVSNAIYYCVLTLFNLAAHWFLWRPTLKIYDIRKAQYKKLDEVITNAFAAFSSAFYDRLSGGENH